MASEVSALVEAMDVDEAGEGAGFVYWTGRLARRDCVVVRCGMGKVSAASCVQKLIDDFGIDCFVVCGLAGGLRPDLHLGDVVVGESYVQHDLDASPIYPKFEVPGLGISIFHAPPDLVDAACEAANAFVANRGEVRGDTPRVLRGMIATGDQFVNDRGQVLRRELPEAMCVEMEGAAIAQVCHMNRVPFVIIRIISDNADEGAAVDFLRFVEEVAPAYTLGIVRELLERLDSP
jgi:adenosylhomocysteine nucleosidase